MWEMGGGSGYSIARVWTDGEGRLVLDEPREGRAAHWRGEQRNLPEDATDSYTIMCADKGGIDVLYYK